MVVETVFTQSVTHADFIIDIPAPLLFLSAVSKTTKELNLRWKEFTPVDISKEVKMPQFEISQIIPARCQETFHIGRVPYSIHCCSTILVSYDRYDQM